MKGTVKTWTPGSTQAPEGLEQMRTLFEGTLDRQLTDVLWIDYGLGRTAAATKVNKQYGLGHGLMKDNAYRPTTITGTLIKVKNKIRAMANIDPAYRPLMEFLNERKPTPCHT